MWKSAGELDVHVVLDERHVDELQRLRSPLQSVLQRIQKLRAVMSEIPVK